MDPQRLFGKHPPRSDMTTLLQLVEDWQWRFGPGGPGELHRDTVVEYAAAAANIRLAVRRACMSLRPNGKLHNHQSRVPAVVRNDFDHRIWHIEGDWLRKVEVSRGRWRESPEYTMFDQLYDRLDNIKPKGIGVVTLYDVATRIAAYLGCEEQQLYFHAGVREGWRMLYPADLDRTMWEMSKSKCIPRYMLPDSLRLLPTSEVEDFLCAYRKLFGLLTERE